MKPVTPITGASPGIGAEFARVFAAHGLSWSWWRGAKASLRRV